MVRDLPFAGSEISAGSPQAYKIGRSRNSTTGFGGSFINECLPLLLRWSFFLPFGGSFVNVIVKETSYRTGLGCRFL